MFQCKIVTPFKVLPHQNLKTPRRFLPYLGLRSSWGWPAVTTLATLETLARVGSQNDVFIKGTKTVDRQIIEVDSLSFETPTLETLARVGSQNDVFIKSTKTVDLQTLEADSLSFEIPTLETLATLASVQSQIFTKLTDNLQSLQSQRVDSSAIYFMLSN